MNRCKISIITPNYNYSEFISETIESVLSQDYENIEHIIIDDGSTDDSVKVIKSIQGRFPNKIVLIEQENHGQTFSINRGLEVATGDILCWLNSDDLFCPGAFSTIVKTFSENPEADAICGNIEIINSTGELVKILKYLNFDFASGVFNGFGKIISSNSIFWKKELSNNVGKLKENFKYAMDSEYWSRLLVNKKVINIDSCLARFRWHEDAKTIIRREKNTKAYLAAKKEDYEVFKNSYSTLKVSKIISIKYSFIFKAYYKIKRYFLKTIHGHYF